MYAIKTEDVYEYFSSDKEMFDFINYLNALIIQKSQSLEK